MYDVKSKQVHKIGRFSIVKEEVEKDGMLYPFSYIDMKEGVCVIPRTEDKYVVLREYRHAIDSYIFGFVCGSIDKGYSPEETVKKELMEETGYKAVNIEQLGFFYPSCGSTNEKIHLYVAEVVKVSEPKKEALEDIRYQTFSFEETDKIEFVNAAEIICWQRYKDNYM